MPIDLNTIPTERDGDPLPDLNENPPDEHEQEDETHHLQDNAAHAMAIDLNTVPHEVEEAQSHLVHEDEQVVVHGIDLNADACDLQEPNEDMEYMQNHGVHAPAEDIEFYEDESEDSDFEHDHDHENIAHQSRNLTEAERHAIYEALLERSTHGRLKRNTTTRVAAMLQVSRYQVQRVWRRVKECCAEGRPVDVRSRRPKNCGRKKIQVDLSAVLSVPLNRRSTIRSLAAAIGVKKSTLHRCFKEGQLRRHSNTLKPLLKEDNKKERLQWCICMLDPHTLPNDPKFIDMENIIHVDEKWY
ncbi:unnamed protein product, partial [Urochloa humidicola]